MEPTVVLIATYDTKGVEADTIKKRVEAYGSGCLAIDVGVGGKPTAAPDVSLDDLCVGTEYDSDALHAMPRGTRWAFPPSWWKNMCAACSRRGSATP